MSCSKLPPVSLPPIPVYVLFICKLTCGMSFPWEPILLASLFTDLGSPPQQWASEFLRGGNVQSPPFCFFFPAISPDLLWSVLRLHPPGCSLIPIHYHGFDRTSPYSDPPVPPQPHFTTNTFFSFISSNTAAPLVLRKNLGGLRFNGHLLTSAPFHPGHPSKGSSPASRFGLAVCFYFPFTWGFDCLPPTLLLSCCRNTSFSPLFLEPFHSNGPYLCDHAVRPPRQYKASLDFLSTPPLATSRIPERGLNPRVTEIPPPPLLVLFSDDRGLSDGGKRCQGCRPNPFFFFFLFSGSFLYCLGIPVALGPPG